LKEQEWLERTNATNNKLEDFLGELNFIVRHSNEPELRLQTIPNYNLQRGQSRLALKDDDRLYESLEDLLTDLKAYIQEQACDQRAWLRDNTKKSYLFPWTQDASDYLNHESRVRRRGTINWTQLSRAGTVDYQN
jgi:hypothetical protein